MDETLKGLAIDQRTDMLATANDGFDMSLEIVGDDVVINGVTKKVIFTKKENANGDTKHISSKIGDIEIGDVVEYQSRNWLIVSFPIDNGVYLKADVRLTNSTFPIKANKTRVSLGYNDFGEERFDYVDGEITQVPCIASFSTISDNVNDSINLPEGQILITIPFTVSDDIDEGKEFTMYGTKFKIFGVDYTKSINNVGLLVIKGKKV